MIFQTIHVLVSFVAADVLALVWLVDDDSVFRRYDARVIVVHGMSSLANGLRLGSLVDWDLGPFLV